VPVHVPPAAVVVLAAGQGTRMRSAKPKVLHTFAGRSLLGHVLAAAIPLEPEHIGVVVGQGRDQVSAHLEQICPGAAAVVQEQQLGTGHAVATALDALPDLADDATVMVLLGDTPLLTAETLLRLHATHLADGNAVTLLSAVFDDPSGYGRVLRDADGAVERVVEQLDATAEEREIREGASGVYVFHAGPLRAALAEVGSDNAQGEQYLPDTVPLVRAAGGRVGAVATDAAEVRGVNDRAQLADVHRVFNDRITTAFMRAGVRIVDPATTWLDADVDLAPDCVVHPGCTIAAGSSVSAGAEIGPDVTLTATHVGEDAVVTRAVCVESVVGPGASVGPYAYLRPGTRLGARAKVGTYVEVKNSEVGEDSKVPHLTYVGDATIGRRSNIGAATVFVNYDGVSKSRSRVGDDVRTGADNLFVAPVTVGDGAYTAAGSVITTDVPPGALGVARARQRNIPGWVERRRAGTAAAESAARARAAEGDRGGTAPGGTPDP
jgi:bifunctional UDP-N-acetylglucosamine pyrophosphorylase / glucosamine-1-phosphate N-acetyltransferase